MTTIHTIGHSNRSESEFFNMLRELAVSALVDVRAQPHSRRHPQFDSAALREACERSQIQYHWAGRQLGGMRSSNPESLHRALGRDLRGFADHMNSEAFRRATGQLVSLAEKVPVAVMCSERLPAACHRSLISDYLTWRGVEVVHALDVGVTRPHRLRAEARVLEDGLVYDRGAQSELGLL